MKTADIPAWLAAEAPDFAQGVALYTRSGGSSKTYLRLFALPPTDYSRQVLTRELRALVGAVPGSPPALPAPPVTIPTPAPAPAANPELLADVRRQLRAARDERSHTHPHLTAPRAGKKARLAAALRILELTEQEQLLQQHEAHVLAHGRLPGPVATADVTDAGELRQRLGNLLSRRSKLRKQPARADDLATVETDIALIREKLIPTPRV